jgi:hypothetical protein
MVNQNENNHITFNRCITILAKHLRDLLAEKVLIVLVMANHTREILSSKFSEKVQELYAGIYSKELKILPTNSENGALALSEAFMQGNIRENII